MLLLLQFFNNVGQSLTRCLTDVCPDVACFFGQNSEFWNFGEYFGDEIFEYVMESLDIWHKVSLW